MKPRLLDLFCGGGGCSVGYSRAGFEPYGIDNNPKPLRHYPFPYICMDALEAMDRLLKGDGLTFSNGETLYLADFAAFHASPPCQGYSIMKNLPWVKSKCHPLLIAPIRERLIPLGKPYVIENVMQAKLSAGWLCGQMFGLSFYRHRAFETNFFWMQPGHPNHRLVIEKGRMLGRRADKGHDSLALEWMNKYEQSQAIPPSYTEYIGRYLMQAVMRRD